MKRRWLLLLLALVLVVAGAVAGWTAKGVSSPVLPPLPPETVPVVEVRTIETPGPERVIERVRWRTREVAVPGETVERLVEAVCPPGPDGEPQPVEGRVEVRADQFLGVDADGAVRRGWQGEAVCEVRGGDGPWIELVREPFDLALSEAVAEAATNPVERPRSLWEVAAGLGSDESVRAELRRYGPGRRIGVYAAARYALDPAETYQPSADAYLTGDEWALEVGVAWKSRR